MSVGAWSSPLFGVGGGHDDRAETILAALLSELGDGAQAKEDGSQVHAEMVPIARALASADSVIDLRVNQWFPEAMTIMVERWEAILGIVASTNDSLLTRQSRIGSRLLGWYNAQAGSISAIVDSAFGSWDTNLIFSDATTAVMHWPNTAEPTEWYSTVANVVIEFIRPVGATDEEVDSRINVLSDALEESLPAWAKYTITETYAGSVTWFLVGESRLGYAALGE